MDLSHSDPSVLEKVRQLFFERAKVFENARHVNINYNKGRLQFDLKLLPKGGSPGLTSSEVGQQVRDAFYGALPMRQLRATNEVEVLVRLPLKERKGLYNLQGFVIRIEEGLEVSLLEVVLIELRRAFTNTNRRNICRVVRVGKGVEPKFS